MTNPNNARPMADPMASSFSATDGASSFSRRRLPQMSITGSREHRHQRSRNSSIKLLELRNESKAEIVV